MRSVMAFQFQEAPLNAVHPLGLPQISGTMAWADFSGDTNIGVGQGAGNIAEEHRQDFVVSGYDAQGQVVTQLFRCQQEGDGTRTFAKMQDLAPAVRGGALIWGDYNNDGFPDLLVNGLTNEGNRVTTVYRNAPVPPPLQDGAPYRQLVPDAALSAAVANAPTGMAAWLDYDNDGDLDLLVSGTLPGLDQLSATQFYRNDNHGAAFVRDDAVVAGFPYFLTTLSTGDFDRDGDVDLLATGYGLPTKVWENGGGVFREHSQHFAQLTSGRVEWADFNRDGYLDLVAVGRQPNGQPLSAYQLNLPNADGTARTFDAAETLEAPIGGVPVMLQVADIDHDGAPDVMMAGRDAAGQLAFRLYHPQQAQGVVVPFAMGRDADAENYLPAGGGAAVPIASRLLNGNWSCLALGDYVGAGSQESSLDLTVMGFNEQGAPITFLLTNPSDAQTGSPAAAPASLVVRRKPTGEIRFDWEARPNHTFELRAGTTPDGVNIVTSNRLGQLGPGTLGHPLSTIPQPGNVGHVNFWELKALVPGDVIHARVAPVTERFQPGSYSASRVFRVPFMNHDYQFEDNTASALADCLAWVDADNDGDQDLYIGGLFRGNELLPAKLMLNDGVGHFTEPNHLVNHFAPSDACEWGDVNGDGRMDLLTAYEGGTGHLVIYRNQGLNEHGELQFSQAEPLSLTATAYKAQFADFDSDGDLDVAAVILDGGGFTKIYRNDGPQDAGDPLGRRRWQAQPTSGTGLPEISYGYHAVPHVSWVDFDNDRDPDLLITGIWSEGNAVATAHSRIFRNDGADAQVAGQWVFTPLQIAAMPQLVNTTIAWGDIDRDGFLDLYITGTESDGNTIQGALLLNRQPEGQERTFKASEENNWNIAQLSDYYSKSGSAVFADIDRDGKLDLVCTGSIMREPPALSEVSHLSVFLQRTVDNKATFMRHEPVSSGRYTFEGAWGSDISGDLGGSAASHDGLPFEANAVALADMDSDGKLDLAFGTHPGVKVFHNEYPAARDEAPQAPTQVAQLWNAASNELTVAWLGASDPDLASQGVASTPVPCLRYLPSVQTPEGTFLLAPQQGLAPVRWPLAGDRCVLKNFAPRLGVTYSVGVAACDFNRNVSPTITTEFSASATLVATVEYTPRLGQSRGANGITVFLDSNHNHSLDAGEPTGTTDASGRCEFTIQAPMTYRTRIIVPQQFVQTSPNPADVVVQDDQAGRSIPCGVFQLTDPATALATVYFDRNQSGMRDNGEEVIPFWLTWVDTDGDEVPDINEPSASGSGLIPNLMPQMTSFAVGVDPNLNAPFHQGWNITTAGFVNRTVQKDLALGPLPVPVETGVWRADYESAVVYGHVVHDSAPKNGRWDPATEEGLEGFTVFLDYDGNGVRGVDEPQAITNAGGGYTFNAVRLGVHSIHALPPANDPDWNQNFPINGPRTVVVQGTGNINDADFGFIRSGEDVPNQANALNDSNKDGVPQVVEFVLGRTALGNPMISASRVPGTQLLTQDPSLPVRTDQAYPVFKIRHRSALHGIILTPRVSTHLLSTIAEDLTWRQVGTSVPDGDFEVRTLVVLPATPGTGGTLVPSPSAIAPTRAFLQLTVNYAALPTGG
jgi:hypothetical protein